MSTLVISNFEDSYNTLRAKLSEQAEPLTKSVSIKAKEYEKPSLTC